MCEFAVKGAWSFEYVPEQFKTQDMCESVVRENPRTLKFVPDWFVTDEMVEKCRNKLLII